MASPRRAFLASLAGMTPGLVTGALTAAWGLHAQHAAALPARPLVFPRDHGAHPDLRTEWWYVTGQLQAGARVFGFQVTFFRSRVDGTQSLTSAFAARQLLFAHAVVTDLQGGRLWHDQRIAREGFGLAQASRDDLQVTLRDWSLARARDGQLRAVASAGAFALDLQFTPVQPLLLQGVDGLSRKGPQEQQASYYYSLPQLQAAGSLRLQSQRFDVTGSAWLDHEWSEELLHPQAVGWDWIGMNLADGSALTAFRLRRGDGSALWDGGSWRGNQGAARSFAAGQVRFTPLREWTSPHSGARYPVAWQLETPAGRFEVHAMIDDQELDSRASTGAIYWEGLSRLLDAQGREVGRGYLEMTGYAARLQLGR